MTLPAELSQLRARERMHGDSDMAGDIYIAMLLQAAIAAATGGTL